MVMKSNKDCWLWIVLIILTFVVIIFISPKRDENYSYLTFHDRGVVSELNNSCMQNSNAWCMLTDGTTGKCIDGGVCTADLLPVNTCGSQYVKPYCTTPIEKEGCRKFCNCLDLKGDHDKDCMSKCLSWYP